MWDTLRITSPGQIPQLPTLQEADYSFASGASMNPFGSVFQFQGIPTNVMATPQPSQPAPMDETSAAPPKTPPPSSEHQEAPKKD